ncbi:MetQ/NlpA family ABC transporter substrate-binding protein [Limosilactobacillus caecicola]|uniref:MetQ/NlpA family ABC transporter substrate-binding protein n=1 Tax=Limosilactobacillus caecicola TaxID=2941332 RepID=UPI00203D5CF4|nr:MetQ/NlpA family ABC transporter substrate-binding protein [Limosilactobacillus caecicola]
MKRRKHRGIIWTIVILVILLLGGGTYSFAHRQSEQTITLGSQGTDTQVWQYIAKSKAAKKAGLKIEVKDFTDSASLDKATAEGKVDVNAFQSYAYYTTFNKSSKEKLAALGTTYIQPMGLYSGQYKSVKSIPNGSTIAIANDAAAESRGLKLLESAGLIKLKKHNANTLVTPNDITSNPKNLHIKTITSTQTPSLLKDNGVAAVVIDNNTAQSAGLNVFKQSIYHEKLNQNTKANVNVIATAKKNANNKTYKKLVKLYHNRQIQKYIQKKFPGKVEVNKPLSYLK